MHLGQARVNATVGTGLTLVVGALVLGVLIVFGLYRWDVAARQAEAALRPAPVAPLAPAAQTSAVPVGGASSAPPTLAATLPSDGDAAAGQLAFARACNACHPNANAGIGPALHGSAFASRYPDDAALIGVIRQGKGGMPAFGPDQLSGPDLTNVVTYLRSLGTSEPEAEPTPTPRPRVRGG